jgi:hypothetical protein
MITCRARQEGIRWEAAIRCHVASLVMAERALKGFAVAQWL